MSNSFVLESVEHDSQNEIYRYPMGAAEAQSMVRMRIKVQAQSKNISVKIHTWNRIDGERLVVMNKDDSITDANYYVTYIEMPEKGCLEWYYFIIELGDKKFFYGNAHDRMGGIGHVSDGVEPAVYQILYIMKVLRLLTGLSIPLCIRFSLTVSIVSVIRW